MDTIPLAPKSSATLPSPKVAKGKPTGASSHVASVAASYGCEHVQALFKEARKLLIHQYTLLQEAIHDRHATISQTLKNFKGPDGRPVISITPTYLCLQCPSVHTPEMRDRHWEAKKHAFSVESKLGCLYCQSCQDFVYDPVLEDIRLQKGNRKRKFDEFNQPEDPRLILANSTSVPCRAIGLRGLYNMGQTCFMSVILQSLIHNPFIRAFYLSEGHRSSDCDKEGCTSCAMDDIFTEFHSLEKTEGYGAVNMLLASWMSAQALAGYQQQDAHEYMQFILNSLHLENGGHADTKSADCACVIHKTFYGKLQSTVTCDKCRNVTTALDPVMDLSLDLRSQAKKRKMEKDADGAGPNAPIDLRDCLERFTSREKLAAAEYTCQSCGGTQQNATKQLSIQRLPPVLPIHLKRFEHSKSSSSKLETKIKFPLQLDMYPYTTRAKKPPKTPASIAEPPPSCMYELSSVVVHKGKLDSGHYVSYSREGGDWFLFDDSKVVLAREAEVLNANAYLLFYMVRSLDG